MQGRDPQATGAKSADCTGRQSCKPCGAGISSSPEQNRKAARGRGRQCKAGARKPPEQKRQAIRGRDRQATEVGIDELPGQNRRPRGTETCQKRIERKLTRSLQNHAIRNAKFALKERLWRRFSRQPAHGSVRMQAKALHMAPSLLSCAGSPSFRHSFNAYLASDGRPSSTTASAEHGCSRQDAITHGRKQPYVMRRGHIRQSQPLVAGCAHAQQNATARHARMRDRSQQDASAKTAFRATKCPSASPARNATDADARAFRFTAPAGATPAGWPWPWTARPQPAGSSPPAP